jgi:hypothetical protein
MGGGGQTSSTSSKLYNWKDLLPPWVQKGQQAALPWLMGRAMGGGMTPEEERNAWGTMRGQVEGATTQSLRGLGGRLAQSGVQNWSPAAAGAMGDIYSDRASNMGQAALNFAKVKQGAKESSINQLLTSLYTPPPHATGQNSSSGGGK